MLPVFVYGTLRPGSWNHEDWLAPFLTGPCRPGLLAGHALHHLDGLPYVVPDDDMPTPVVGDVAAVAAPGLDRLDELEDVAGGHYARVEVALVDGSPVWTYIAGPRIVDRLGPATLVAHGDWLRVA